MPQEYFMQTIQILLCHRELATAVIFVKASQMGCLIGQKTSLHVNLDKTKLLKFQNVKKNKSSLKFLGIQLDCL